MSDMPGTHTRSAKVFPMRRKKEAPPTSKPSDTSADTQTMLPGEAVRPNSAQRNPSTTPLIGLRPYHQCQGSRIRLLGYAIGVASIQNCTRNGTTYLTSRNSTFRAESQRPTPRDAVGARSKRTGSQKHG